MTRGWKKGVGSWVSTSVLVRFESSVDSTNFGEESMSWISPGIGDPLDGFRSKKNEHHSVVLSRLHNYMYSRTAVAADCSTVTNIAESGDRTQTYSITAVLYRTTHSQIP